MKNIRDIRAQIAKHEEELEALMLHRKEEVFEVLKTSGGVLIDNRLLAGFAMYAESEEGKESKFLEQLAELGGKYLPRHPKGKDKNAAKKAGKVNTPDKAIIKKEKVDG